MKHKNMPVTLLSSHNYGLEPPEERFSPLTLSIGDYRGRHVIPTENAFIVFKSTIFLSAILGKGVRTLLERGDFSFHLSLFLPQWKKKNTRFWQPFCFLIQIRESKLLHSLKNHDFWNQQAKIVFEMFKLQCY